MQELYEFINRIFGWQLLTIIVLCFLAYIPFAYVFYHLAVTLRMWVTHRIAWKDREGAFRDALQKPSKIDVIRAAYDAKHKGEPL